MTFSPSASQARVRPSLDQPNQAQRRPNTATLPREYHIQFAACYTYSPKGESDISRRSRLMCARVKNGSPKWLKTYVTRVHDAVTQQRCFVDFFGEHTLLIPVPQYLSCAPASLWVAKRLAFTLQEAQLGAEVWTGLRRVNSVERSSSAWMWQRPTVQRHYQSLTVIPSTKSPSNIVLVDDVITKGRTLAAAGMRLGEAFPGATIRAFALVRTMGFIQDVVRLFDPCEGAVRWNGEDAYRDP